MTDWEALLRSVPTGMSLKMLFGGIGMALSFIVLVSGLTEFIAYAVTWKR